MKLKGLVFMFMFCVSVMSAQEPYFCTKEGTTLEYTRRYTDGEIKWYHQMKILEVIGCSGPENGKIVYTSVLLDDERKPKMGDPIDIIATVTNGSVEINMGATMANVLRSVVGNAFKITSTGDNTVLPVDMTPGDKLADAFCSVRMMGMTMRISVTDRVVLSEEKLTTPVGTFDCVVIQEHKVEKGMTRNRTTTAKTWYSRGMGMIRHDTYDKKGELETIEELTSIN